MLKVTIPNKNDVDNLVENLIIYPQLFFLNVNNWDIHSLLTHYSHMGVDI